MHSNKKNHSHIFILNFFLRQKIRYFVSKCLQQNILCVLLALKIKKCHSLILNYTNKKNEIENSSLKKKLEKLLK